VPALAVGGHGGVEPRARGDPRERLDVVLPAPGELHPEVEHVARGAVGQRDAHRRLPDADQVVGLLEIGAREAPEVRREHAQRAPRLQHPPALAEEVAERVRLELRDEVLGEDRVRTAVGEREPAREVGDDPGTARRIEVDVDPALERIGAGAEVDEDHRGRVRCRRRRSAGSGHPIILPENARAAPARRHETGAPS